MNYIIPFGEISWSNISKAIDFYKLRGYRYIEVPWVVEKSVTESTLPDDGLPFTLYNYDDLVGSAEQSFVQMMLDKQLKKGRYISVTPCFRDESVDSKHSKVFVKAELFSTDYTDFLRLKSDALSFFKLLYNLETRVAYNSLHSADIEALKDNRWVEIGSYGSRSVRIRNKNYKWSYGTGLAEPRLSSVLKDNIK